jgi:hypothetical protein
MRAEIIRARVRRNEVDFFSKICHTMRHNCFFGGIPMTTLSFRTYVRNLARQARFLPARGRPMGSNGYAVTHSHPTRRVGTRGNQINFGLDRIITFA